MTTGRFATLSFSRDVAAPVATLWQAWTAPAARAVWSPPAPGVTVEILEADSRVGGREISVCRSEGTPDVGVEVRWLELQSGLVSVISEVVSSRGAVDSVALVTANFSGDDSASQVTVTVQLSSQAEDMVAGYEFGYGGGLANLAGVAERTMVLERVIKAPVSVVWGAWMNAETLPKWWGPDGFSCKTSRINLGAGGEWVFDMIGPDGTVFPNHHRYGRVIPEACIDLALHAGENGPKHADSWVTFAAEGDATRVTLGMVMATPDDYRNAVGFGAVRLGLQTLGKLARFVGSD
jgi:uncharacterized protein YndB with AHSA1/START domain